MTTVWTKIQLKLDALDVIGRINNVITLDWNPTLFRHSIPPKLDTDTFYSSNSMKLRLRKNITENATHKLINPRPESLNKTCKPGPGVSHESSLIVLTAAHFAASFSHKSTTCACALSNDIQSHIRSAFDLHTLAFKVLFNSLINRDIVLWAPSGYL